MPPTETETRDGMLCLSRHENCPWGEALKTAKLNWTGLQYTCLKIFHLYCKVFDKEDVMEMVIRKTCKSCGCDRLQHSVYHEELGSVRDRLGLRDSRVNHNGYDSPPGLTAKQTELYWAALNERAPTVGGATGPAAWRAWRTRALASQLPKQDLSLAHCRHIDEQHKKQFEDFVAARNEIALDIGVAYQHHTSSTECMGCNKAIRTGSIAIQAPRIGEEAAYHPACFACSECDEFLVELAYCAIDGRLYCVRHYAEKLKPRCNACDELIFSGEYTKAMNKDWHSGHFCCWQCDESLTGQRYVLRDEHPYCIKCYESVFANGCEECNKTIGIDSKDLSYKDKHWHEACFLCAKCRVSLVDKQFGSKLDKIYCGNCYDAQFASRCDGCGEVFRAGTKKMEYKTRQWHEKCFCCVVCKNPIGTKSFIPREQEIYCAGCYEDKFATRCVKCNKIITQGGVTYKNEPWHRECFTCTNCNTSLAGQRFTSRDEKPYCAECFGELFAKRCTSCSKPITGIGGTRFISFEDRHWHNDCFICAQCKTSLVGKGFITDGQDIICPECAKQKLM
ncbi:protein espinas isoform X1 [Amyelois transitella]|uniref:protein espinas isoform X1 n=1 Tax=Amyelois transitella TaxID=680683 RepID=UPI00067E12E9|nr:protein espinas isoform X1 [Amyelois transitella]XP_060801292.1 protein espinas isoform X1 [Amyelois transitella]XP_060801293.1 protein espinas isoform X1 [Amyelois transitella]XP_060801294.1 protein espinas isoform X1 [Amyelois transitella]